MTETQPPHMDLNVSQQAPLPATSAITNLQQQIEAVTVPLGTFTDYAAYTSQNEQGPSTQSTKPLSMDMDAQQDGLNLYQRQDDQAQVHAHPPPIKQSPNELHQSQPRPAEPEASPQQTPSQTKQPERPSINSVVVAPQSHRNNSIADSDVTSPSSSHDHGQPNSDESIPQRNDSKDGQRSSFKEEDDQKPLPPWSELKTKAGKERKRLPLACIACRRKKIRCSGEKPACKHCLRSRIPCVYKVTQRKAQPRTDYMAMLDKRLKRMEDRVIKIIPKEDSDKTSTVTRAVLKPPPPGQSTKSHAANKKRAAEEAFGGTDVEDWARQGASQAIPQPRRLQHEIDVGENKMLTEGMEFLPQREIQEHLAEVFFDHVYGQSYHLLHKPSFMRKLKAGKVPPVLTLAVCAVSARFSTHPKVATEPNFLRGEEWAKPAREIVLRRYDEPNITILTVLLMLGLHEFGTCQGGRSWMFGGMAIRMAYALQLHRELDHDPLGRKKDKSSEFSFTDREIRRRTMWACFLMDRFNSSGTERPMFANEETIQVQLPIRESHFQMEIPGPTESLNGDVLHPVSPDAGQTADPKENMGVAAYLVRVIALWGRVIKHLNLGGTQADPHPLWHPDSQYSGLKKQAEEFGKTLPASLQYNAENLAGHVAEKLANQFLFLHICYSQVMLFLHKFAIPTAPGGQPPKDMPADFVKQASNTAVAHASDISQLLEKADQHLVSAPFVGYCAFVAGTVHVWGLFSGVPEIERISKRNLKANVTYLSRMKKYWGMFHYMSDHLKSMYRQCFDAKHRGLSSTGDAEDALMFQYGDWFNKYPHGVSGTDYQDPTALLKKEAVANTSLSEKSDLQSVEEFFTNMTPEKAGDAPQKKGATSKTRKGSGSAKAMPQGLARIKTERPQLHLSQLSQHTIPPPRRASQNQHSAHPIMPPPHDPSLQQSPHPNSDTFPQNMYTTPTHPTFPYQSFPSSAPPTHPQFSHLQHQQQQPQSSPHHPFNMLIELDRRLVYNAYAGHDPNTISSTLFNNMTANMQNQQQHHGMSHHSQQQQQQHHNNNASSLDSDGLDGLDGTTDPTQQQQNQMDPTTAMAMPQWDPTGGATGLDFAQALQANHASSGGGGSLGAGGNGGGAGNSMGYPTSHSSDPNNTSAWLMPFNMQPPVGDAGDWGTFGDYASLIDGVGDLDTGGGGIGVGGGEGMDGVGSGGGVGVGGVDGMDGMEMGGPG
ncbi:hypothetical protein MMC25_000899 [Agyrium rufum]|nr:hypothetical protein [Agyrium rufum]